MKTNRRVQVSSSELRKLGTPSRDGQRMNRKQPIKSPLYAMSEEQAAAVADHARTHTIPKTVAWLAQNGLKTSNTALGRWLSTRRLNQRLLAAESRVLRFKDWMKRSFPDIPEAEVERRANLMFQFEAVEFGDSKTYLAFSTARHRTKMDHARFDQRERGMAFDREKWLAAQRTKIEAGLDALYLEIKDKAEARQLFQKFKDVATRATT